MGCRRKARSIAIAYPASVPWMALFQRGVAAYADRQGGWKLTTCAPLLPGIERLCFGVGDLRDWEGDGVIAAIYSAAELRAARSLRIPVVNAGGAAPPSTLPRVMVDHSAIGRLAADHLLARGLCRFAFFGDAERWWSMQRRLGFVQELERAGYSCELLELRSVSARDTWRRRISPLTHYLQHCRPPVGVMAANDYGARVVLDECLRLTLDVPHDVVIIGADNDVTVCEFCRPTLSSVSRNAWRVGYECAATLDRLMSGKDVPKGDVLILPDGVARRQSTDMVAVDDPEVTAAVRFVYNHLGDGISVKHLLHSVGISRRELELRFRQLLAVAPHEYLRRARVERARQLLAATNSPKMAAIAATCGFNSVWRMDIAFRDIMGMTPSQYRGKCRSESTDSR